MKYLQYLRLLCKNKQYRLALNPGDIALAVVGLVLSFHWHMEKDVLTEQFGIDGSIALSAIIVLGQFFLSVHNAKMSICRDKLVFYKVIGFHRFDICLLIFHTFMLSSIAFSLFFAMAFNLFVFDIGIWVAAYYFFFQIVAVAAMLLLLSKIRLISSKKKRVFRHWDKLFSNKYLAIAIKEIFEIRRYPGIIFSHIIVVLMIYFFILVKMNNVIAIYFISAFTAGFCYDSYGADGKRYFLYRFLHVSKYQLFKYKLFASIVLTLFWVTIYILFYSIRIADFAVIGTVLIPVVLLNTCLQHFTLGIICAKKYPFREFFNALFLGLWFMSAIPLLSFPLYGYAIWEATKLRKVARYA